MPGSRVILISPEYPPVRGGVADHSRCLARQLSSSLDVTVLTSAGAEVPEVDRDGFPVARAVADWQSSALLLEAISHHSSDHRILWQYVPHMFGRGGVNLSLPRVLAQLRRQGRRQILLAHEIAAPFSPWPHRFIYAAAHRWQWNRITRSIDGVGISTETWLEHQKQRHPASAGKFRLTPSPSNIPHRRAVNAEIEAWKTSVGLEAAGLVLTYFGTISASKRFGWVTEAFERCLETRKDLSLVVIGDKPRTGLDREFGSRLKALGYLHPSDADLALQSSHMVLLPFLDGASERRTSLMAGLQHGCPVLTTAGAATGPSLRQAGFLARVDASNREGFAQACVDLIGDPARRVALGQAAERAYIERYDWSRVTETLSEMLLPHTARPT